MLLRSVLNAVTNRERSTAEKLVSRRFKPLKVGPTPDHPIGDEYEQAHQIDVMHRPGMVGYGESTLNAYKANGQIGRMGRMISPDMPHIHPSVQVMAPRPGDYEKNSGADYLFAPPEIMAPKPPYLYPTPCKNPSVRRVRTHAVGSSAVTACEPCRRTARPCRSRPPT